MKAITVWIGDQKWKVRLCDTPPKTLGECDWNIREIRIYHGLRGEELTEVAVHELLHARWPDLSEEAVTEVAQEMAGVLTALGIKHAEEHDG